MYQIVYVSTATREYDRDELERILAVSRKNNSLDGVTGMLCYHGGTFFQMLARRRRWMASVSCLSLAMTNVWGMAGPSPVMPLI